jgi:hypothetical protein
MKKRFITLFVILIFSFQSTAYPQEDGTFEEEQQHEIYKRSAYQMFHDQDFVGLLNKMSPMLIAVTAIVGISSYLTSSLIRSAEDNVKKKMFTYTFREFKILQNPKEIQAYVDARLNDPLGHHKYHGIDNIIERLNAKPLAGNSKLECHLGSGRTITIPRNEFGKLIYDMKDVPLNTLDEYFSHLYTHGFDRFIKSPTDEINTIKKTLLTKSLIQRSKKWRVEKGLRTAHFYRGRVIIHTLIVLGAITFVYFFYFGDEEQQEPDQTFSSLEIADMILNDWEMFDALILDTYPEFTKILHQDYQEFKANKAWFLNQN